MSKTRLLCTRTRPASHHGRHGTCATHAGTQLSPTRSPAAGGRLARADRAFQGGRSAVAPRAWPRRCVPNSAPCTAGCTWPRTRTARASGSASTCARCPTGNPIWDELLRAADPFRAARHPLAHYASTAVRWTGSGFGVQGALEIAGVSVALPLEAKVRENGDGTVTLRHTARSTRGPPASGSTSRARACSCLANCDLSIAVIATRTAPAGDSQAALRPRVLTLSKRVAVTRTRDFRRFNITNGSAEAFNDQLRAVYRLGGRGPPEALTADSSRH